MSVRSMLMAAFLVLPLALPGYAQEGRREAARTLWVYGPGDQYQFRQRGDGRWVQEAADGRFFFDEVARRPDFVELYDPSRKIGARLYDDGLYTRPPGEDRFQFSLKGHWAQAPEAREGERREGERREHERLYNALAELREARAELRDSRDDFRGHKEEALSAIDDCVATLKTMLRIRRDEDIGRPDRGRDYYREYRDRPHLRQVLKDLRDAREYLEDSRDDFGGLKERALRDIRRAREHIEAGLDERERR